jgi:hypothetical protein
MKIDYVEGDRIVCIGKAPISSFVQLPWTPEVGEVYTAIELDECPSCPDRHLRVELAERPDWCWHAHCFKKVPELRQRKGKTVRAPKQPERKKEDA